MSSFFSDLRSPKDSGSVSNWLHPCILKKFESVKGIENDLEDIKETLTTIQAVLKDAERQSRWADKEAERLWLKRLKLVVYDIKDLPSSYEANNPEKKEKSLDNMVQNLQEATSVCVSGVDSIGQRVIDSLETTSFLDQNHERTIVGREEEKETLVRWLLDDKEEGDFDIIPIVGFGGLGKTTLAQLLFNDERIKQAFDIRDGFMSR
ncbi:hypothetical protein LUZ60_010085 [Juncus effusus]|nr:hypothetical protein LUZ60_010085 [Juncus effusus]